MFLNENLHKYAKKEISPSRRTASPLPTDYESEAYGLGVCINRTEQEP